MAVTGSGEFAGSVSGGCIEGAVVQAAMEVIDSGAPRSLEFGVTNEMAWEVGLACGGKVQLLVERASSGKTVEYERAVPSSEGTVASSEGTVVSSEGTVERAQAEADGQLREVERWTWPGPKVVRSLVTVGRRAANSEPVELLRWVVRAQRNQRDIVLATRLSDGAKRLLDAAGRPFAGGRRRPPQWSWPPIEGIPDATGVAAGAISLGVGGDMVERAVRSGKPLTVETPDGPVFLRPYVRPPHLVIVGAVHIAQALVPLAAAVGLQTTVVDPREGFAADDRFPGSTVVREWPDQAMARLNLDHRSAVAALTHDPKIDDPALLAALASDAFYVGALGSRKTQAARRERLAAAGCSADALDRIRGPIGLPIGAATPEEIALAALAEVVAALRLGR